MKTPATVRLLSVLLLIACAAAPARAASFSAELVDTRAGQTQTSVFNYQDKSYRYESVENGQTVVVTVDGSTGTMRLSMPAGKAYYESGPDDDLNRFTNPFGAYASFSRTIEVRAEGTESIAGFKCTKQVLSKEGQVYLSAWLSEEFGFPLKVEIPLYERTVELRNIKPGPQDAALFALPADYKLQTVERVPVPEWAKQVAGAPVLTPPFEKTLAEGEIIRMRPQAGRSISLEATNPGKETSAFCSVGFKDGKPLDDVSMNTANLEEGQSVNAVYQTKPAEADDIVVRVVRKSVTFKTAFVAAPGSAPEATGSAAETPPPPPTPAAAPDISAELNAPASAEVATRIEVTWKGPANRDDYISVARPDQPPSAFLNRTYVREGNPLKLWTPSDAGDFEVRYVLGSGKKLLAKAPIAISAVTAKVEPAGPVNMAAWIEVTWEGPAREGDYISVARPNQPPSANVGQTPIKESKPVKVRAPSEAGDYEVRYILARGVKLLAKAPVTVNPVTAEIKSPAKAVARAEFEVQWKGPGYPEDFVSVARGNQPPSGSMSSALVRKGNPAKLHAPREPGTYEVRYILGYGNRLLAKTTITITAP
jgi:hypothetical protein